MEENSTATPATTSSRCVFSLRIVTLDYYMARPIPQLDACYSSFLGQPIAEVPVVRIFGTTLTGQKMCLHLHKVFPYFYVPYEEDLPQDVTHALSFVRSLASAIEKALKLASNVGAKRQHVYSCSLVRGKKFYGFHAAEQLFVKIVLYYPQEVPRISGLLLGGGILNRRFQPYESHIPFLLQVMVDHNLAGMGHIHLSDVKFRQPVLVNQFVQICSSKSKLKSVVSSLVKHIAFAESLAGENASAESVAGESKHLTSKFMEIWCRKAEKDEEPEILSEDKQTTCELEGDTAVEAILNRCELSYTPLEKALPEVKMVQSLIPIWDELNITEGMDAIGKRNCVLSPCHGETGTYENDFRKMFERFMEVHEETTINNGGEEPSPANLHEDFYISEDDLTPKSNALLPCTQAAHSKSSSLSKYLDENESRPLSMTSSEKDEKFGALLNEDIIMHQLTQSSQETDEEAVELLKWMISSQHDDVPTGYASDNEKVDDETSWSQMFQCADEALAKAISDYEFCSQQECQAIIDCLEGAEARQAKGLAQEAINLGRNAFTGFTGSPRGSGRAHIPQSDGSCDEEMADVHPIKVKLEGDDTLSANTSEELKAGQISGKLSNPLLFRGKDQVKGWGPLSAKFSSQQLVANSEPKSMEGVIYLHKKDAVRDLDKEWREESETTFEQIDHSVRDLMRSKRLRRQQTYTSSMEGSTPVIMKANTDKDSTLFIKGHAADGSRRGPLLSFPSDTEGKREEETITPRLPELGKSIHYLEKKNVLPGSSSKFGPLPFVRASLSVGSPKALASGKEVLELEECSSVLEEDGRTKEPSYGGTKEPSPCTNSALPSLQDSQVLSCQGDNDMSASQAWEKVNTLIDAKKGVLAISSLNFQPVFENKVNSCSGPSVEELESTLFMSEFCKKPPTTEHLLATFKSYSLPLADNGEVFYGKADDLPDQPAVMAGMLFKVRSKDVDHLPPYEFVKDIRGRCLTSIYTSANTWVPYVDDSSTVLPSHFRNDGTVLFLLSPVKLPPTGSEISKWLRLRQIPDNRHGQIEMVSKDKGIFIDVNDVSQPSQEFRPSSPKYDETFLLPYPLDVGLRTMSSNVSIEQGQNDSRSVSKFVTRSGNMLLQESRIRGEVSQISGPTAAENRFTPISQAGFRDPASTGHGQQLSLLSVEAFASTRGDLRPDPRYDSIKCIAMILHDDTSDNQLPSSRTIALLNNDQDEQSFRNLDALIDCEVIVMPDEVSLLRMFVWFVRMYDPDMIVGWEIQGFSLGLLAERAANLGMGLLREISRLPAASRIFAHAAESLAGKDTGPNLFGNAIKDGILEPTIIDDEWGRTHGSGIHVGGRIVLNLWRIMRGELKLGIYTLEAVAEAVLQRKVPSISWRTLTFWFSSGSGRKRHVCIKYYLDRANLNLQIMNQLDLVNRTSELARVFGIEFFSVLSRGSQYRVESMMLRIAHSQNYLLISPSRQQVAAQPAMQCLPLVMEPESRFYTDPVVVLDFQSLYPSMMIAYNLCFSTCLGKVVSDNPKILGVTSLNLDLRSLKDLKDCLTFTPNGIMFISSKTRPGVLPRLLDEILSTRIMVKQSMKKLSPSQKVLERVLNARQLALKLISNVTYGYTAAGFSGRMPCAELADSIVQSGRYTLERAINFVNTNTKWNARVVYGDTDSMFVLLKGRTRLEAFKIGEEIARAITELNPHPVTLKMEKVYHPCVLLTKKRYVGYSYESPNQAAPKFDAKGIETVRRDSCGAVAKTLEKSLRVLFETHDISQVKAYLQRQWGKIMSGRVSFKDFIFAKEVRLGTYSTRASVLPPAAIVATKAMAIDPRAEPRYGERIPYVVIHGEPGARLVDMVVDPYVLVSANSTFRLHDIYYITKQIIPALQRVFGLIGVDLSAWYNELPRVFRPPSTKRLVPVFPNIRKHLHDGIEADGGQTKSSSARTIDHYYLSQHCSVCGDLIQASCSVCDRCLASKEMVGMSLLGRSSCLERRFKHFLSICGHCGGGDQKDMEEGAGCTSLACSVFYERIKAQKELRAAVVAANLCGFLSR